MPKNIAFFSDGTGNDRAHGAKTNVAKLCDLAENMRVAQRGPTWQDLQGRALDRELAQPNIRQITCYDAGVGVEMGDLIGRATGSGISGNIMDGYGFVLRFYELRDRIFLFGFSRGAYTARSLAGLISLCGVPKRQQGKADLRHDEQARSEIVSKAYDVYKTGAGNGKAGLEQRETAAAKFRKTYCYPEHDPPPGRAPYFIGVWDTVRSLGVPLGTKDWELTIWPDRFHDHVLNPLVRYAFHALSIDDKRLPFHPTLWDEPTKAEVLAHETGQPSQQVFEQVWFPGAMGMLGAATRMPASRTRRSPG